MKNFLLSNGYEVIDVSSDEKYQREDTDFIVVAANGAQTTIEVKTDLNISDISVVEGCHICNFKGKPITITVLPEESSNRNLSLILSQKIMNNIVTAICKVVNFRYGRKSTEQESKFDRPTLYI